METWRVRGRIRSGIFFSFCPNFLLIDHCNVMLNDIFVESNLLFIRKKKITMIFGFFSSVKSRCFCTSSRLYVGMI